MCIKRKAALLTGCTEDCFCQMSQIGRAIHLFAFMNMQNVCRLSERAKYWCHRLTPQWHWSNLKLTPVFVGVFASIFGMFERQVHTGTGLGARGERICRARINTLIGRDIIYQRCHFWAAGWPHTRFGSSHKEQPWHISFGKTCIFLDLVHSSQPSQTFYVTQSRFFLKYCVSMETFE